MKHRDIQAIQSVDTPVKFLALVLVVVQAGLVALILALPEEHRLFAFGIVGCLISLAIVTLLALERIRATALAIARPRLVVTEIPTRRDLYRHCARLISTATTVLDTSWGIDPRARTPQEEQSREEYRRALETALQSGKICRELVGSYEGTGSMITSAKQTIEKYPNYAARVVPTNVEGTSMLEFLVIDSSQVLLSHVDAKTQIPKYLYVESDEIADLFTRLHSEHWAVGVPVEKYELTD